MVSKGEDVEPSEADPPDVSKGEDVEPSEADPPDVSKIDDDPTDPSVVEADDEESRFVDDELWRPSPGVGVDDAEELLWSTDREEIPESEKDDAVVLVVDPV